MPIQCPYNAQIVGLSWIVCLMGWFRSGFHGDLCKDVHIPHEHTTEHGVNGYVSKLDNKQ